MNSSQPRSSKTPIQQQTRTRRSSLTEALLTGITSTLELAEKALEGVPVPGAKAAVGSILLIIKRIDSSKKNTNRLQILKQHVKQLCEDVLTPLCSADKDMELPSEFRDGIDIFIDELRELASDLEYRSSRSRPRRVLHADDDRDDLTLLSELIKNAVQRLMVRGNVALQLDKARELYNDQLKLINGLPRAKNASHICERINEMSQCFPDTRTSVLREIKEWIQSDDGRSVFWLSGMAGIGKTTIARTIVEQDDEIWVATFFFSRDDEQASDHLLVFPTLAHQLAFRDRKVLKTLAEMIRVNADCTAHPLNKQFSELIVDPLKALGNSRHTVLFVLDALDECSSKKGASDVLRLFFSCTSSLACRLRILITGRPEEHLRSVFSESQNYAKIVLHDIENTVVKGDIERYVRHGLQSIFTKSRLPIPDDKDVRRLAELSDNLFIFASTALRYIGDDIARDPKTRLEVILGNNKVYKSEPYSAVDKLYQTILDKAVPAGHNSVEEIKDRFQRVIGTIVTLREPLPLSALTSIVKSEVDVHGALDVLHSMIRVPPTPSGAARVLHPSFVDFITSKERCTDSRFLVDVRSREISLALRCLELMVDSLGKNMARMEDETMRNIEVVGLEERAEKVFPSELRYACLHWASHMMASGHADKKCLSLLSEFAHGRLLNWMEAMSLLGEVPRAILIMRDMHAWGAKNGLGDDVNELLYDGHRCLLQCRDGLTDRALHVYHGGFQFLPRDTALYRVYGGVIRSSVRVVRGERRQWTPLLSEIDFGSKSRRDKDVGANASLALSPNGQCFATAAEGCEIALWDAQTGTHIATLEYAGIIYSLEFLSDGQLASGNDDGEISVWDIVTGSRTLTVNAHNNWITSLSASQSKLASGSCDKTVRVWDTATWECMCTFECGEYIKSVAMYPRCDRVVACTSKTFYVWDTETQLLIASNNISYCRGVAVSNDGKWLAVAAYETISLHDASALNRIWSHDRDSIFISFSHDSSQLVSANNDNRKVELLDVQTGNLLKSFKHVYVTRAVFSHDGARVLSASFHGTCRLWDLHLTEEEKREDSRVKRVKFSEDGSLLAVVGEDNLEMWKTSTWERRWSVPCEGFNVDFSHDGLRVLVKRASLVLRRVLTSVTHAYDVRSGDALCEIGSMPNLTHDHVHMFRGEVGEIWQCSECKSSLLKNCECWFTESDRWLWVVEDGVARRLIHIPAEYVINDIKAYSCYVAIGCWSGLIVLDTGRSSEVV